jgi:hypothetical protein
MSIMQVRLFLAGQRQRIGQNQAALGIGVVDLDGQIPCGSGSTSPGRKADRRNRVLDGGNQHPQATFNPASMIIIASASTLAAPPMSFFMLRMPKPA